MMSDTVTIQECTKIVATLLTHGARYIRFVVFDNRYLYIIAF